jgi:Rha family phage regulatory protein|nr:MAG TPA: regulatory protein [Caudoviricetes sp.]
MKQLELFPVSANGLVSVVNNKVVTTSLQVSKVFEKTHHNVLRDIRNLECSSDFQAFNFESSFYLRKLPNNATKKEPMYYLTRDGFTFLAMGFTGKIAARFKEAYINAFNEMERKLAGITVREDEIIKTIRELCEDINSRIKGHEKMLKKEHGVQQAGDMSGLSLLRCGTIKEQLTNIFAILNNNIMSGQFAWAKLEKVEKENKEMKKELAKVASKLLNYYY